MRGYNCRPHPVRLEIKIYLHAYGGRWGAGPLWNRPPFARSRRHIVARKEKKKHTRRARALSPSTLSLLLPPPPAISPHLPVPSSHRQGVSSPILGFLATAIFDKVDYNKNGVIEDVEVEVAVLKLYHQVKCVLRGRKRKGGGGGESASTGPR